MQLKHRRWAALAAAPLATLTFAACTPEEVAQWQAWHAADPTAAEAHLHTLRAPEPQPEAADSGGGGGWTLNWDAVARCESGGNWSHPPVRNRAGTFSGGIQIGHQYWNGYGGYSAPYLAPKSVQIAWAEDLIDGSYAAADRAWQCVGGPARSGV